MGGTAVFIAPGMPLPARGDQAGTSCRTEQLKLSCSFLSRGQAFEGTQNVSNGMQVQLGCKEEAWRVNVRLHDCDLEEVPSCCNPPSCCTLTPLNLPTS